MNEKTRKYEVYVKNQPETAKEIEVTNKELMDRYGHITKPTPMFLKDLACRRGLFGWGQYPKLIGRRKR